MYHNPVPQIVFFGVFWYPGGAFFPHWIQGMNFFICRPETSKNNLKIERVFFLVRADAHLRAHLSIIYILYIIYISITSRRGKKKWNAARWSRKRLGALENLVTLIYIYLSLVNNHAFVKKKEWWQDPKGPRPNCP